jgi:hypothetical protein
MSSSMRWLLRPMVACCISVLIQACATVMSGRTQTIQIRSDPAEVLVTVQPGGYHTTTPGRLTLPRLGSGYLLRFQKSGYEPVDMRLSTTTNGWVWGNVLIGGLIGIAIDYTTGAAYSLSKADVEARLLALRADVGSEGHDLFVFDSGGSLLASLQLE